jgi:hypothetical protein
LDYFLDKYQLILKIYQKMSAIFTQFPEKTTFKKGVASGIFILY